MALTHYNVPNIAISDRKTILPTRPSRNELRDLYRVCYRLERYHLFASLQPYCPMRELLYGLDGEPLTGAEDWARDYLGSFYPWEDEEMVCIEEYIHFRYVAIYYFSKPLIGFLVTGPSLVSV